MEPASARPWYKKKRYLIPAIFFVSLSLGTAINADPNLSSQSTFVPSTYAPQPAAVSVPTTQQGLSNDNYYTNVSGNTVHSPAHSTDNAIPVGATAQCGDGTYSFSQHRSGTCSHHGGVSSWL